MKANREQINQFLATETIALAGVSRDPKKFGNQVFQHLLTHNYALLPIHPEAAEINGINCLKSISEVPETTKAIWIALQKPEVPKALKEALDKGIKNIWIQQFSESPEVIEMAKVSDANIVLGRCIFMYTQPEGFHKFHETITKIFRVYAQ